MAKSRPSRSTRSEPVLGAATDDASRRVARLASLIESRIAAALGDDDPAAEREFGAARLAEAMRYSLSTPGKRLRPLLLLSSADAVGGDPESLVTFAVGLEMIHAYSLIHDDLPAMDDDDLRRGQPTNHVVYGDGMAILAGDGLLTEAFAWMLQPVAEPKLQLEVAAEVARASGRVGMVGGQAADLLAEARPPDEALLRSIHARKTGALIRASVRAGCTLAGAGREAVECLDRFARHFGLAFQIADDVKDEIAPPEVTGKRRGGDRAAGKMTYPALHGIDGSRERCTRELETAIASLEPLAGRADALALIARDAVQPAFLDD